MESQTFVFSDTSQLKVPFPVDRSNKTHSQIKTQNVHLQKQLKALNKAEEYNVRFHQAKELEFRIKYDKYLTRGNFESSLLTKQSLKRINQSPVLKTNSGELPLHKLIYTNGEVDVEKVACLHLLSVYHINIDFSEKRNLRLFPKRSKPTMLEASVLPFYIVDIIHQVDTELKPNFKVGDRVVILVNSHIEKLTLSILEVLAIVSPHKLDQVKQLVFNMKVVQEIMNKTKIFNLLAQISDHPVLLDITNYRLEVAEFQLEASWVPNVLSVCRIKVKDKSKKLDFIQTEIKKIISKHMVDETKCGDWPMFHKKFCNCPKFSAANLGTAISLLTDDGREFALVTGSGCHLPSSASGQPSPSLTAIIKSSARQQPISYSGSSLFVKGQTSLKHEQNKLLSSLLHKVDNSHRILIGKRAAEIKSVNVSKSKIGKQKISINKIMKDVFSKESLISFASTAENDELKLLFQPCCKGGLNIGSFILDSDEGNTSLTPIMNPYKSSRCEDELMPQMIKQEKSVMQTAFVKQDIFTSETRTKMKHFLFSENPGGKIITYGNSKVIE